MSSEEHPEEGRYVWRAGRVTCEAIVPVDGVVVLGVFLDGEVLRVWDGRTGRRRQTAERVQVH